MPFPIDGLMLFQGHVTSLVTFWHLRCHFLWGYIVPSLFVRRFSR